MRMDQMWFEAAEYGSQSKTVWQRCSGTGLSSGQALNAYLAEQRLVTSAATGEGDGVSASRLFYSEVNRNIENSIPPIG